MEDQRFEYETSYREIRHTPFSQAPMCIFTPQLLSRLRRLMAEFSQCRHYPRYEWESEDFYDMAADWLTRRDFRAIALRTVKMALCEHVRRKLREMGRVERLRGMGSGVLCFRTCWSGMVMGSYFYRLLGSGCHSGVQ